MHTPTFRPWMAALPVALCATAFGGAAHASTVVLVDTPVLVGANGPVTNAGADPLASRRLDFKTPGKLSVTLTALALPESLSSLSFKLSDDTGRNWGSIAGIGTQTFEVGAGSFFALSYGNAKSAPGAAQGVAPWCVYGLRIEFTPVTSEVPVPLAAPLLLSALGLLYRFRRPRADGSDRPEVRHALA